MTQCQWWIVPHNSRSRSLSYDLDHDMNALAAYAYLININKYIADRYHTHICIIFL